MRATCRALALVAVSVRDEAKARHTMAGFRSPPPLMGLAALAEAADVIVECLPSAQFAEVAEPAIARGRIFMPLSVGALIDHMHLVELARETGARIVVPTGALLGLDAVRATAEGKIASVTHRHAQAARGSCRRAAAGCSAGLSVDGLKAPLRVFAGSAREAIAGFPANVNVAVALSLAGIGPDRTQVEMWADPGVTRNTHTVIVKSDSSDLTMTIENIPSRRTRAPARITALSVLAALRRLTSPLVVGS